MLDKDKLFLVTYLDVRDINSADVVAYIQTFAESIKFDNSVMHLIIPYRGGETKVECINPVLLTEAEYDAVESKIKTLQAEIEEAIERLKNE